MIYKTEDILEEEGLSFEGPLPEVPGLGEDLAAGDSAALAGPPWTQFEISVGSKELLLVGSVKVKLKLNCGRCADKFEQEFNQDFEETFPLTQVEINVAEEIRQAVILTLPDKPLCRGNCLGLCPICGANRNTKACGCRQINPTPFGKLKDIIKEREGER
ncbi:MAG: DUF177 domain-containing protein [Elusimicrobia bacterium]|nr:DUF177 domain-containing protein [Elusimicrobiota bacterium]